MKRKYMHSIQIVSKTWNAEILGDWPDLKNSKPFVKPKFWHEFSRKEIIQKRLLLSAISIVRTYNWISYFFPLLWAINAWKWLKIHNLEKLKHRATFINTTKHERKVSRCLDIVQILFKTFTNPLDTHSTFPYWRILTSALNHGWKCRDTIFNELLSGNCSWKVDNSWGNRSPNHWISIVLKFSIMFILANRQLCITLNSVVIVKL